MLSSVNLKVCINHCVSTKFCIFLLKTKMNEASLLKKIQFYREAESWLFKLGSSLLVVRTRAEETNGKLGWDLVHSSGESCVACEIPCSIAAPGSLL